MAESARLQLKITLEHLKPAVWRRVVVSDSLTFLQLHDVIQRAMGWEDCHLHQFELANPRLLIGTARSDGFMDFGDDESMRPEDDTRLADMLAGRRKLRYWYDFGDDWRHTIAIEKRLPADPAAPAAELVGGQGACPPEDCGGTWGYAQMRAAVADPTNPDRAKLLDWLGEDFDPAGFDLPSHAKAVAGVARKRRRQQSIAGNAASNRLASRSPTAVRCRVHAVAAVPSAAAISRPARVSGCDPVVDSSGPGSPPQTFRSIAYGRSFQMGQHPA